MSNLGEDIAGAIDLDPGLDTVSGREALAQALARRLSTETGGLWYDPEYGYDLLSLVGTSTSRAYMQHMAEQQCLLDERVFDVRVLIQSVETDAGTRYLIDLIITDEQGEFSFTLAPANTTFELLNRQFAA